jgi:hypothetical protein
LRGFTVDDALIPARYAAHIAAGLGYRFNAQGPVTDGVTPLGWAYLLAPFARGGPLAALYAAKWIGLVFWVASACALGAAVARSSGARARFAALLLVGASAALGAWSAAGMETGVVLSLGALAVALPELGYSKAGVACAGICAAFRPEMLPWAIIVSGASALAPPAPPAPGAAPVSGAAPASPSVSEPASASAPASVRSTKWPAAALRIAIACAPFLLVLVIRWAVFGRPAPLSALAKPPDAELGAKYALACFLLTGPVALVAPLAWRRLSGWALGLLAATFAHFAAIALAGGDWMPLSRLAVPALPTAVLCAAHIIAASDVRVALLRVALAVAGEIFVMVRIGPTAARVLDDRLAMLEQLRAPLASARVVAALDVGWLGAATSATIVDLAGVTDPAVAALPGGHTTKAIPPSLLEARGVDTIVLLLDEDAPVRTPWTWSLFSRGVEDHVARFPGMADAFEPVATSSVPHLRYLVLHRISTGLALAGAERPDFVATPGSPSESRCENSGRRGAGSPGRFAQVQRRGIRGSGRCEM